MFQLIEKICYISDNLLTKYISHIFLFTLRLLIACTFWELGLNKLNDINSAILLFQYQYRIPFVSPVIIAYSVAFFEIICSIFLIFGVFTRLSTIPLIVITLMTHFLAFENDLHFYWLTSLLTIFIFGSGAICLNDLIKVIAKTFINKNLNRF